MDIRTLIEKYCGYGPFGRIRTRAFIKPNFWRIFSTTLMFRDKHMDFCNLSNRIHFFSWQSDPDGVSLRPDQQVSWLEWIWIREILEAAPSCGFGLRLNWFGSESDYTRKKRINSSTHLVQIRIRPQTWSESGCDQNNKVNCFLLILN